MIEVVSLLNQYKPKFVLVQATDPLDEEFLARYLTSAYTRGRTVGIPPDLLLSREDDGLLQGALVIGNYTLDPNQDQDHYQLGEGGTFVFPSTLSRGTFDAMNELLKLPTAPPIEVVNGRKSFGDVQQQDDSGTSADVPSLKLSILGRYGYLCIAPLKVDGKVAARDPKKRDKQGQSNGDSVSSPFSWDVAYGICLLIGAFQLYASLLGTFASRFQGIALFNSAESNRGSVLICIGSLLVVIAFVLLLDARALAFDLRFSFSFYSINPFKTLSFYLLRILLWVPVFAMAMGTTLEVLWNRKKTIVGAIYFGMSGAAIALGIVSDGRWWAIYKQSWASRGLQLASSVSPVLPALILLAGMTWWIWTSLQGEVLLGDRRPRLPHISHGELELAEKGRKIEEKEAMRFMKLRRPDDEEAERVCVAGMAFGGGKWVIPAVTVLAGIVIFVLYIAGDRAPLQTVERPEFDWSYSGLFISVVAVFLVCLLRIVWAWGESHRILEELDRAGFRDAFSCLKGFSWEPLWNPASGAFEQTKKLLSRKVEGLRRLQFLLERQNIPEIESDKEKSTAQLLLCETGAKTKGLGVLDQVRSDIEKSLEGLRSLGDAYVKFKEEMGKRNRWILWKDRSEGTGKLVEKLKSLEEHLAKTANVLILGVLRPVWDSDTRPTVPSDFDKVETNGEQAWRPVAEEFVALVYTSFLMNALLRIRTLVMCVSGLFLSLVLATSVYPFQPRSGLRSFIVALFVLGAGGITFVFVEMHRNATLRRLTQDKEEGGLGIEFWIKLLSAGALPLIGLLASQFPFIGNALFAWLQPALQALK